MMWAFVLLALVAGSLFPLQAGINSRLAGVVGHPLKAALVSFAVGFVVLLAYSFTIRKPWPSLGRLGEGAVVVVDGGPVRRYHRLHHDRGGAPSRRGGPDQPDSRRADDFLHPPRPRGRRRFLPAPGERLESGRRAPPPRRGRPDKEVLRPSRASHPGGGAVYP